jgi:hypothetical protein
MEDCSKIVSLVLRKDCERVQRLQQECGCEKIKSLVKREECLDKCSSELAPMASELEDPQVENIRETMAALNLTPRDIFNPPDNAAAMKQRMDQIAFGANQQTLFDAVLADTLDVAESCIPIVGSLFELPRIADAAAEEGENKGPKMALYGVDTLVGMVPVLGPVLDFLLPANQIAFLGEKLFADDPLSRIGMPTPASVLAQHPFTGWYARGEDPLAQVKWGDTQDALRQRPFDDNPLLAAIYDHPLTKWYLSDINPDPRTGMAPDGEYNRDEVEYYSGGNK